jgi:hypothetical protein
LKRLNAIGGETDEQRTASERWGALEQQEVSMSLCVICGYPTLTDGDVCSHHTASLGDDWAAGNRLMCDFLHRGIVSAGPAGHASTRGWRAEG